MDTQIAVLSKKSISAMGKPHPKEQFTPAEDSKLISIIQYIGDKNWESVSSMMGTRNARQCKERWTKYLSPSINKSAWTEAEDQLLLSKYSEIGPKWVKISSYFDNRTDASIKNRWNVLKRREKRSLETKLSSNANEDNKLFSVTQSEKVEAIKNEQIETSYFLDDTFESTFFMDDFLDVF